MDDFQTRPSRGNKCLGGHEVNMQARYRTMETVEMLETLDTVDRVETTDTVDTVDSADTVDNQCDPLFQTLPVDH